MDENISFRYGRNPDHHDVRDAIHEVSPSAMKMMLPHIPATMDVFQGLNLPVYDQGQLGSCTANTGVLYRRFLAQKFPKYSDPDMDLSRLFLYYQERKLPWNGGVQEDCGAEIRDIFKTLTSVGVCPEQVDPYKPSDFASPKNDDPTAVLQAGRYKIGAYHRVPDVLNVKLALVSEYPVALGFTVYESFEHIKGDGVMPMPNPHNEDKMGGHAVCIRGYDESRKAFLVQNSWGHGWGYKGCFWMPYAFLENVDLSGPDFWIGHLGPAWK